LTFSPFFFWKRFRHGLKKHFYGVFELPLPRNAKKRTKKKAKKTYLGLVGSSEVNQIYAKVRHFFFGGHLGAKALGRSDLVA
jgi:hypothetical protein